MKVSIIIPVREINDYIRESILKILAMDYADFEILIFPDIESSEVFPKTKIIPTGKVGPSQKRNLALQYAQGEILAFLDDDAYPQSDWLAKAVGYFENLEVAAVGGPAVTPQSDSFWQKVSGAVFLSKISGGNPARYWPIGGVKEVDDWPSVNLLVRKIDFTDVNGFDCAFWPGEDTKLCLDLTKNLGKKIIYDPAILVYHHRRAGLKKHLRQVGGYGLHRGYFAKKYPENSRKLKYFLPSMFLISMVMGWLLGLYFFWARLLFVALWLVYSLALAIAFFNINQKIKNIKVSLATLPYILLTHLVYGYKFLQGLLNKKLSI
ncbi:MAG: glycosyltransferase [Candidatus Gribaldobacteria bacterium]|nr:glycosyltransferase [Candidatus Gribaldobacteria bacterium]